MGSLLTFSVRNRGSKIRKTTIPIKYTLTELSVAETATPGVLDSLHDDTLTLGGFFSVGTPVHTGVFAGQALSFSDPGDPDTPGNQTHDDRIVLTYEITYNATSEVEKHKVGVPCPDLAGDWTFPAGQTRVLASEVAGQFSATANSFISAVTSFLTDHGFHDLNSVSLLYVDLTD